MRFRKVRAGVVYRYDPVVIDRFSPPLNAHKGDLVRVVNLEGCPPCNTMGHAHIQHLDGSFAGLVCTNSLQPIKKTHKKRGRK